MIYGKLSIEELKRHKYPNLIAELIESGYSICTLSEHMGHGRTEEDNPEIWGKIRGEKEIYVSEVTGLAKLFAIDPSYLFSEELDIVCDEPMAVFRWYDWNKKMERDRYLRSLRDEIKVQLNRIEDESILHEILAYMPKVKGIRDKEKRSA